MNIFGLQVTRANKAVPTSTVAGLAPIPSRNWFGMILESFSGAWQQNVVVDNRETILAQSSVWSCIDRIATDVSLFRPMLMNVDDNGIKIEAKRSPLQPVLEKPNHYQTRIQFFNYWVVSKLIYGNAYILKERDNRGGEFQGVVRYMYVLDPRWVTPLLSESGELYYQLNPDPLNGVYETMVVPASEIIHDRMSPMFSNGLVGTSPLYACAMSATNARKIQNNSSVFFANMSRPSGMLTAPGTIRDETAVRLKELFEKNFGGENLGRLFVGGDGLEYKPMQIPAEEAQLIQQLEWTVGDVARCFHVPLYKIGAGQIPTLNNAAAINQQYYDECVQPHVEAMELLLKHGLGLKPNQKIEFDTSVLLRLDPKSRAETNQLNVRSGVYTVNEARLSEGKPPVKGGDEPMLQQQMWPISLLVDREPPDDFEAPGDNGPQDTQEDNQNGDDEGNSGDDSKAITPLQGSRMPVAWTSRFMHAFTRNLQ